MCRLPPLSISRYNKHVIANLINPPIWWPILRLGRPVFKTSWLQQELPYLSTLPLHRPATTAPIATGAGPYLYLQYVLRSRGIILLGKDVDWCCHQGNTVIKLPRCWLAENRRRLWIVSKTRILFAICIVIQPLLRASYNYCPLCDCVTV